MMKKGTLLLLSILSLALTPLTAWGGVVYGRWTMTGPLALNPPAPPYIQDGFVINTDNSFDEFAGDPSISQRPPSVNISGPGIRTVAVQPWDGKVLIGGDFTLTRGGTTRHNLARLNTDGTLDDSFSPQPDGPVNAMAIRPDPDNPAEGRIYLGGGFGSLATAADGAQLPAGGYPANGLARLRSGDGSLDLFFPGDDIGTVVNAIVLSPDGASVLVGGKFNHLGGVGCGNIARLSVTGSNDGKLIGNFPSTVVGEVDAIALQQGMTVIGGSFTAPASGNLARFKADDRLDTGFSASPGAAVRALAVQADGMLVLGGEFGTVTVNSSDGPQTRHRLARLKVDGTLDDFNPDLNDYVTSVAIQPDGSIIAAGNFSAATSTPRNRVARFELDGSLDAAFDPNVDGPVGAIAWQSNGSFLAAGSFMNAGGKSRTCLARFYPNGLLEDDANPLYDVASLNVDLINFFYPTILPDGSVIMTGEVAMNGDSTGIVKLDRNLNIDTSFHPPAIHNPQLLEVQPDGCLILGGSFRTVNGASQWLITRLTPTGAVDPTFKSPFDASWVNTGTSYVGSYKVNSAVLWRVALLPRDSRTSKDTGTGASFVPKGTALEDGMMYVGGVLMSLGGTYTPILRLKKNGDLDPTFTPPLIQGKVWDIVIQPDNKILVSGDFPGKIMRLETNGDRDESFLSLNSTYWDNLPLSMYPDKSGQLFVVGSFQDLENGSNPPTLLGAIGLLNNLQHRLPDGTIAQDGSVDTRFTTQPISTWLTAPFVDGVTQQADGGTVISGWFEEMDDGSGPKPTNMVGRFDKNFKVDSLNGLMSKGYVYDEQLQMPAWINLQEDGKILVPGYYDGTQQRPYAHLLSRFSNGWATQELTVSQDGSTINWMRGGTSPEFYRVEFYEKGATPGATWNYLGRGTPIDGGWSLAGQSLPSLQNHYVRARGVYAQRSVLESVRLFYLQPSGKQAIQITVLDDSREYGAANPTATTRFSVNPPLAAGDAISSITVSSSAPADAAAGKSYPLTAVSANFSQGSAANYNISYVSGNLTIGKKPIAVTVGTTPRGYGAANPTATTCFSVNPPLPNGDAIASLAVSTAAPADAPAGSSYRLDATAAAFSQGSADNYTISYNPGTVTIGKTPITITAGNASRNYGAANPSFSSSFSINPPLPNGDAVSGVAVASGAPPDAPAGAGYPLTASAALFSHGSTANYTITYAVGSLTIAKAPLTITVGNAAREYGAGNPSLSGTFSLDMTLPNGDAISGVAVASTALANAPAGGSYPLTGSGAVFSHGSAANYDITYRPCTLTISRKGATLSADDRGKVYGKSDPELTTTALGFLAGDLGAGRIGFAATRVAGENAQGYDITPSAADSGSGLLANYAVQYLHGTFTISKAPLTITAQDKSKTIGAPLPVLTASYDGLASFDGAASLGGIPSLTTTADEQSPNGSYPIVASLGTITSANYSYSFVNGFLTVTGPNTQSIDFPPMRPKTYGDGDFDPGASASSGLPVGYLSSVTGVAGVVAGKIRVVAPGSADITAWQGGNDEYEAVQSAQTLKVNPPPWNGLGFDGIDDLLRVEDAPQLNFGGKGGFTIESWLHVDGSQPDGCALLSKGEGGSAWSGYQLMLYQDRIAAEIGNGNATLGVADGLVGKSSLNDGRWHHVALSVDRSAGKALLYLDGRLEAQVASPVLSGNPDNADALQVGVDRGGTHFFRGEIDELRVWDTARSQDEIRGALSQIIDPLDEAHLAAYFHFDEGDAGLDNPSCKTAPERTAHGADGTLHGFALSGPASNWVRSGAFLPLLETAAVTVAASGTVTGGGVVYPNYYPATDVGLCWGSAPNPGLSDSCLHAGRGAGPFAGAIGGLTAGATYHVRGFASNEMGTAYGNDLTFQAGKLGQSITAGNLISKTYGDPPFDPGASSSSGLPVSYSSADPAVATVTGGQIRITGAGSTTITVSQSGDGTFEAAADVPLSLTVAKAPLTVAADDKSRAYLTANPPLTASFRGLVNGESSAVISGAARLSTAAGQSSPAGEYDIVVNTGTLFAQNYTFLPVNGTLSVFKSCQQIIFPPVSEITFGDPPLPLVASTCSGLGLGFTSSNPQLGQVNGGVLTVTGAGSFVITASQQGTDSLDKAPDVSQTVLVRKSGQLLVFPPLPRKLLGEPPFTLNASASSGLAVSYQSADPSVAVINGGQLTLIGAGTTVITATQEGNVNYAAAPSLSQPLTVALEGDPPQLALSTLSSGAVTANPVVNVSGTASDPSGIASLTVNGADLTGEAPLFSGAVVLGGGENDISVSARDGAGNQTTQTVKVTLDATAPAIAVREPADNGVTGSPFFTTSGMVTPGSAVTLALNGGAPQALAVDAGSFTGSGYLADGLNTMEVTANLAGRLSSVKRSVTLSAGKPFVAITDPAEDLRTEQDSVVIKGSAAAEGSELTVVADVNGSVLAPELQSGSFQLQIPLNRVGETRITVKASDSSGNASMARRNIIRVATVLGDLNGDGRVDIEDAMAALRISLGIEQATPLALAHGDVAPLVNGAPQPDGVIDVGDVLVLLRKIVGLVDF